MEEIVGESENADSKGQRAESNAAQLTNRRNWI